MKRFVLVLLPTLAFAQGEDSVGYRVHQGDTLDVVAAEYYGDKSLAPFIVTENHLLEPKQAKPRGLRPGERIKIPVTREIATAKGEGFEALAQTYLGDSKRASFLADYNGIPIDENLAAGTVLQIPPHVTHVASSGESFAMISTFYFGDAKQADMLKRYNSSDRNGIDKGESIVVPLLRAHSLKLAPLDGDGKDRHELQKKAQAAAATALPRARALWMSGDFAGVKTLLAPIAEQADFLDAPTAVDVGLLLGKAHVAFDEQDAAVAAFTQVVDRMPRTTLSAYSDSPKVLDAWRKAHGHVQGE
jgi:hypothetical protein